MEYSRIAPNNNQELRKIHSDGESEWVTVYFKEAYTSNIIFYNIPIKWSIEEFINIVKEWVMGDFIGRRNNHRNVYYSISIIEMCQEIPGVNSEDAPALEESHVTYFNKYILDNKFPGFYIKISENDSNN